MGSRARRSARTNATVPATSSHIHGRVQMLGSPLSTSATSIKVTATVNHVAPA